MSRESDAVPAGERSNADKRQNLDARTKGRAAGRERNYRRSDGRDSAQSNERLHDCCPVQAQADKRTHAGRVLMTRKLGRVARGVKRD
jgi:hypothetical protein